METPPLPRRGVRLVTLGALALLLVGPAVSTASTAGRPAAVVPAARLAAPGPSTGPPAERLPLDGTLDLTGSLGNLEPGGDRGVSRPDGPPRSARLSGGEILAPNDHWDGRFFLPGTDDTVYALAWDEANNHLYAGGDFTAAGGTLANRIARWDGTAWSPLGSGMNGEVDALVWDEANGHLYAGGSFTDAGGMPVNYTARWDGTAWSPLGGGVEGTHPNVSVLAWDGTNHHLYVGGSFTTAGGMPANCIARWDGTSWSPLGSGVGATDPYVHALAWDEVNGHLYVGGYFTTAGGVPADHIARWDGTAWSPLGSGVAGTTPGVSALAWDGANGHLYVGGGFSDAGGLAVNRIACWDGTAWSPLGSGVAGTTYPFVYALSWDGTSNHLYVGGSFTTAGGLLANRVARWDGTNWSALGSGVGRNPHDLTWDGAGSLYVGGWFTTAGGVPAYSIARWDGSTWSTLGQGKGMNDRVLALAWDRENGHAYAAGYFTAAGSAMASLVARWDGVDWTALGSGIGGVPSRYPRVYTLAWDGVNGYLYAGGWFTSAGGTPAIYIARWDGTHWSALGNAMNGEVYALVCDEVNGYLYAGGDFTTPSSHIARWDGAAWSGLGSGVNDGVRALAWDAENGHLYAAGGFTTAGGVPASRVARWDGATWTALGSGVDTWVWSLAWDSGHGDLYVGGDFVTAGGIVVNGVARWDGTTWSPLGHGVIPHRVYDLAWDEAHGHLYAGGAFSTAGGIPANRVARWDGTSWTPLGSGISGLVSDLEWTGDGGLYVGGEIATAGGKPSAHIARWSNASPTAASDAYTTTVNRPLVVPAPGVLGNDGDPEDDPFTAALRTPPLTGTLVLTSSGAFAYTPALDFHGAITFTYAITDTYGAAATATVSIAITVNAAPLAADDAYTTTMNTPLVVPAPGVLGNDGDPEGDPLTAVLASPPLQGTLALGADGSFVYTPTVGYSGVVTFTYRASDGLALSAPATVTITVRPTPHWQVYLPVACKNSP